LRVDLFRDLNIKNEDMMSIEQKHDILKSLAEGAIERLNMLPQPVVRVSGPLTSGGYGYHENLRRFLIAQERLKGQGLAVFDYFEGNDDEQQIAPLELPWLEVMEYYHRPIMATGLLKTCYMMPRWQESNGAKYEHQFALELGLEIRDIPEEWFE
jgi:hypothetical protein